jgi:hypothetical protein
MLITFHSKAAADVLMRVDDAAPLLRATGKFAGGPIPERGVFTHDHLEASIAALETAVRVNSAGSEPLDAESDEAEVHAIDRKVTLHQRAFPLLDMMRKSLAAGADIIWDTSRGW